MKRFIGLGLAIAGLGTAAPAAAEVVERSADHFALRYEVTLEAPPEDFPDAVAHIGDWWSSAHTYSGDAKNLSIALEPGACFCEALPDGATFEHGRVAEYDPTTGVLIHAALGPLHGKADRADWSIGWAGNTLVMTYVVRGAGLGAFADGVDGVMNQQFGRLIYLIEYGEAAEEAGR